MSRAEFIKELRRQLKFLKKEELEKEVLHYINKIDETKKPDEEVIKSFGKMDSIVKEVCERHGLDYKMVKSKGKSNWVRDFYQDLVDLSTILKNSDSKNKRTIIFDLLLLVFITCLLKLPLIFLRDLGDELFTSFVPGNQIVLAFWGLFVEILYVILALTFFVKTFKKWYKGISEK